MRNAARAIPQVWSKTFPDGIVLLEILLAVKELDALLGQIISVEELLVWHGVESLMVTVISRLFSYGRGPYGWALLRQLRACELEEKPFRAPPWFPSEWRRLIGFCYLGSFLG